jgi:hypothetical protein
MLFLGRGQGRGRCSTTPAITSTTTLLVQGPAIWARIVEKALPQA